MVMSCLPSRFALPAPVYGKHPRYAFAAMRLALRRFAAVGSVPLSLFAAIGATSFAFAPRSLSLFLIGIPFGAALGMFLPAVRAGASPP